MWSQIIVTLSIWHVLGHKIAHLVDVTKGGPREFRTCQAAKTLVVKIRADCLLPTIQILLASIEGNFGSMSRIYVDDAKPNGDTLT
jgi:hypothetical protein